MPTHPGETAGPQGQPMPQTGQDELRSQAPQQSQVQDMAGRQMPPQIEAFQQSVAQMVQDLGPEQAGQLLMQTGEQIMMQAGGGQPQGGGGMPAPGGQPMPGGPR